MSNNKIKHDLKNCIISLETIALNLQDELYSNQQAVESLLLLKEEIYSVLGYDLEKLND